MPSEEYAGYRDLISGYIRSSRDAVRCSNRIWAFCNSHGLPLPKRGGAKKAERVRAVLGGADIDPNQRALAESQLEDFEYFSRKRAADALRIKKLAIRRRDVQRLMLLPGVRLYIAFALVVFIEPARGGTCGS